MAKNRRKIDPAVQERLGEVAAELRHIIYAEAVLISQVLEDSLGRETLAELLKNRLAIRLAETPRAFVGLIRSGGRAPTGGWSGRFGIATCFEIARHRRAVNPQLTGDPPVRPADFMQGKNRLNLVHSELIRHSLPPFGS